MKITTLKPHQLPRGFRLFIFFFIKKNDRKIKKTPKIKSVSSTFSFQPKQIQIYMMSFNG
jgi:hypothetical protein